MIFLLTLILCWAQQAGVGLGEYRPVLVKKHRGKIQIFFPTLQN